MLINEDGHCRLTDFGLSKENIRKETTTYSFCGSVAYLAPEILKREGHTKSVDWYLLGACLYELLFGEPPFYSEDSSAMHKDILNVKLKIPSGVSKHCKDLLKKLLEKNPRKRLGCKKGVEDIKKHSFFKGINWEEVYQGNLPLPALEYKEHKSRDLPPNEVFGDYQDFESDQNIGNWSFCKTIIEYDGSVIY